MRQPRNAPRSAQRLLALWLGGVAVVLLGLAGLTLSGATPAARAALVQALAPRTVGDVTRDGSITSADALAILSHAVGDSLPAGYVIDPDGDAACDLGSFEIPGGYIAHPPQGRITAADALAVLRWIVELPVDGTCVGFSPDTTRSVSWRPPFSDTLTVMGRSGVSQPFVWDSLTADYDWPSTTEHDSLLTQALMRVHSLDTTVARAQHIVEWPVRPLAYWQPVSPGTTQLVARWFGQSDTLDIQVIAWNPTSIDLTMLQVPRAQTVRYDTLVVGDTTSLRTRAYDDLGFSMPLHPDSVTFTSRDPAVLSAAATGAVEALATGTSWTVAEWSGLADSLLVTVIGAGASAELDVAGSFIPWWFANHGLSSPGPALSVAADDHSSSWGNFAMRDAGSEPRQAFDNSPNYPYASITENPWRRLHTNLVAMADVLSAIDAGLEIGPGGADTERTRAFAHFMQGLSLGTLAQVFDQSFVITEANIGDPGFSLSPYAEVMDSALARLDAAIAVAGANTFTVPSTWLGGGGDADQARLAALAHAYKARFMATVARTPAERAAADWVTIESEASAGHVTDFSAEGTDKLSDVLKSYAGVFSGWARSDYRYLGPADTSGAYQAWTATPVANRLPFDIETPDRRVTGATPSSDGLYVAYEGNSPFHADRGTYHFSHYRDRRHDGYAATLTGPMVDFPVAELDFLIAEAKYRQGDGAGAMAILNGYRTANGQLPAWPHPDSLAPGGTGCVPQLPAGGCGDLFEGLKWEKRIELFHYGLGTAFFDDRGWGDLVADTWFHLPVPGEVLAELGIPNYTFGGSEPQMAGPFRSTPVPHRMADYLDRLRQAVQDRREEALSASMSPDLQRR